MTKEKREKYWREGCGMLAGLSSWVVLAGIGAYALGNPTLGNWFMLGIPGCVAGLLLYMVPVR